LFCRHAVEAGRKSAISESGIERAPVSVRRRAPAFRISYETVTMKGADAGENSVKSVVVTGCTRGLGLAMVREFVRRGHRVAGCARDAEAVAALAGQVGGPHVFGVADVTDDAAVAAFAERVLAELGPPDLLLNNAAVINRNAPLWEVPASEFSAVIDANIKGVHTVIRHFVPAMIARRSGIIVNFSSGWGRSTSPEVAPYCASKWAIEGLSQALAQEVPRGMAAVALNPGVINTDMLRSCFGGDAASYPSPEKWARQAVPFLLRITYLHNGAALTVE
jgi:NAD(P)-dependent dehydrogenase (short-subunit alcohol dehydrogenase family)